jgi:hypothetical protein
LEEEPGKVVGANTAGAADYDRLVAAAESIMPRLPFPKGVYRFRTFEEADAWTEHSPGGPEEEPRPPRNPTGCS